jgi:hypothetical protein
MPVQVEKWNSMRENAAMFPLGQGDCSMDTRLLKRTLLSVLPATLLLFSLISCDNNTADVQAPSWGAAELIETDSGSADNPQIAMDAGGKAIAVWVQDYDTEMPTLPPPGFPTSYEVRPAILANRFDGSAWGEAKVLWSDYFGTSGDPQITMNANGNAMAIWVRADYSHPFYNTAVYVNYFDGSAWSAAERIQANDYGNALGTQIAMDANGIAIAVWVQDYGVKVRPAILANRFDGSAWGEVKVLWSDYSGRSRDPQITMNEDGNAMAVCVSPSDLSEEYLYVKAIRHDGLSWGVVEAIQTDNSGGA